MELLKRISAYTLISAITGAISFLLLPVLTSYLSPEDYGILSIFNASTRFLGALIPLGMGHLLLVYIIEKKEEYPIYLKAFVKITFTLCLALTLIIAIAHFFISDFFGLPILLAISLPFIALMVVYFETITSYFIYLKQFKQYAKYTLSKFFIEIALVIILVIIFPFSWEGRITAVIVSLILIILYGFYYFTKNKILQLNLKTNNYSKALLKKGFPLIFMGVAIMIMDLSDRFFIENFVGLKETGYYGIASTVASILLMIIGAGINVLRPIIYENLKLGNQQKKNTTLTFKFIVGLLISTILLSFATPYLFKYMINTRFHEALTLTYPLILGLFFWGVFNYFISFLMYHKKNKTIAAITIVGIIINLILNYFFVRYYQTIGAAYATLITYFVITLLISVVALFNNSRK
jgi:O-antigen/teichoic acid export membrane protein